jgi:DNA-binding transcriptional LysR family regulator
MISLDVLTLSDGDFQDLEKGKIDLAINRFDYIPQSFHNRTLWRDSYVCMVNKAHPLVQNNTLEQYLASRHIWVSKTGVGVATGMSQDNVRKLGWVDGALKALGLERNIKVFTRHYQIIPLLLRDSDLVATIPIKAAESYAKNQDLTVIPVPFEMAPYDIKMVWSPIKHHRGDHQWLRNALVSLAKDM